ncbi:MAG: hypothetical protein ACYDIA_25900 [Candidatus Humimicrobiaceae bacterium]
MSKTNKIILLILLLFIASFGVLYVFNLLPFVKKGAEIANNGATEENANEDRLIALPTQTDSSNDCLVLDKQYCALGEPIYENNQIVVVGFNIPKGGAVYAPFKGKYEKNTSLTINGIGYPSIELMDISKSDWGASETRSYFSVVAYSQVQITTETVEKKQPIAVLTETGNVQGDYNLILTFREYDVKTNQWKTNIDLLYATS